jgi:hypothetical protein
MMSNQGTSQQAKAAPPKVLPHGHFYRRVVALPEGDRVRAALEDEMHHMEMHLFHDGERITEIQAISHRIPWSACPGGPGRLRELIGTPLRRMHKSPGVEGKLQCTHLLDLARLAMAHAMSQTPVQYDVSVEDRIDDRTIAELLRNGEPVLRWELTGPTVTNAGAFEGFAVYGAPTWPEGIDDDTVEAAWVMRRVFFIAPIRGPSAFMNRDPSFGNFNYLKTIKHAGLANQCYAFQPDKVEAAAYRQTWRNYAGRRDELLKNFPGVRAVGEAKPVLTVSPRT